MKRINMFIFLIFLIIPQLAFATMQYIACSGTGTVNGGYACCGSYCSNAQAALNSYNNHCVSHCVAPGGTISRGSKRAMCTPINNYRLIEKLIK
jgi:hypothetical protein